MNDMNQLHILEMNDMSQLQVLERRIVCLEARERSRLRIAKALVAVLAVGSLVAGVQEARAWGGCTQFLSSYGLTTFCAGDPALAKDINGNFQVLAKALQDKTGAIASPNITAAGAITANKGIVVSGTISGGAYSPGAVDYNNSAGSLGAVGGAAIVNDMTNYKGLMILGNNAAGGPRSVLVYDNLTVNGSAAQNTGNLNVAGNASISGSSTVSGNSTVNGNSNVVGSAIILNDLAVPANQWGAGPNQQAYVEMNPPGADQISDCPNGQYLCGMAISHGSGVQWYQNTFAARCCSL